jgi:diadenosine tetraphosphatase ApaH/serine/threonine PP2A family protein phosphatase
MRDAEGRGAVDAVWVLGDLVGYGPDPSACLKVLREAGAVCIAGNHDMAAIGAVPTEPFSEHAAVAAIWTSARLSAEEVAYLSRLPVTLELEGCTLVHGSPRDPIWEYVLGGEEVEASFELLETPLCLVGHTHFPTMFEQGREGMWLTPGEAVDLSERRLILNPGGVGQPRDGDPRASYAVFDTGVGTITHYRVGYDIKAVQGRMTRAGLPAHLIHRLSRGR